MIKRALDYVANTNGGATKANFIEDHEPIGEELWRDFVQKKWVEEHEGRIFLTQAGQHERVNTR